MIKFKFSRIELKHLILVKNMVQYKIINVGFPTTKFNVNKKMAEWEQTLNQMASNEWELKFAINQGIVTFMIFEHS